MIKLSVAYAGAFLILAQPLFASVEPYPDPEQDEPQYEVGVDDGLVCQSDDVVGHSLCMLATAFYHFGKWVVEDGYADAERETKRLAEQLVRETNRLAEQAEREAKRLAEQAEREAKRLAEQAERETKRVGNQIASAFKFSF